MAKLCQILAVEKGAKRAAEEALTDAHNRGLKPALLAGIRRTHQRVNDDDPDLPSESTRVQVKVDQVLEDVGLKLARLFDVVAIKDWTNCFAKADIVVGDTVLVPNVPVTYLLFLEKALVNLDTFVRKLPVLDPTEEWDFDPNLGVWATPAVRTSRTKKVPRNHVKAEATDKHPAQVELYYEDAIVGYWQTVKYSGALPQARVNQMLSRIRVLAAAVKMAREQANTTDVDNQAVGKAILDYVFA